MLFILVPYFQQIPQLTSSRLVDVNKVSICAWIEKGKKVTKKKDFFSSSVFLAQKKEEEEGNGKLLIAMLKIYYGGGEKNFWRLGKNREREKKEEETFPHL